MPAAKVLYDASVKQLDRPQQPDEIVTEEDVQQPSKLVRLLGRLLKDVTGLLRRASPARIDFEDVTLGTNGSSVRLAHHFGGRVRWSIIGWQGDTSRSPWDAAMWVRRAFFGPGTLATVLGDFTVGCRFQVSSRTRLTGARLAWFSSGSTRTLTVKLWRDSDGALLASGTASVSSSGCYLVAFTTPVVLDSPNLNVDLTISVRDGGFNYTKTGTDAPFTNLLSMQMSGVLVKALNLFIAGDARPTGGAGTELYWVEPLLAPPAPMLVEDTAGMDTNTLALKSYAGGIASIRVEEAL